VGAVFEADYLKVDARSKVVLRRAPGRRPTFRSRGLLRHAARALRRWAWSSGWASTPSRQPERYFSYRRTTKAGERHFGLQVAAIALAAAD
jgi:hypothetical protein